jgi:LAO/AO transport system kinase
MSHEHACRHSAADAIDQALVDGVLEHRRRPLAKTITLIESQPDHKHGPGVLEGLLPHRQLDAHGISGVPGVGKSTFIEALGLYLIEQGHKVAVLAVDPSSSVTGGSILGDKTRMELLSQHLGLHPPEPVGGQPGGVAEKTREAMLVCEAAGFDVIIIETVGVGQSGDRRGRHDRHLLPAATAQRRRRPAGDQEGHHGDRRPDRHQQGRHQPQAANVARSQIKSALGMLRHASPNWTPPVLMLSALQKQGSPNSGIPLRITAPP